MQNYVALTGVISTQRKHLPQTSKTLPLHDLVIAMWFLSVLVTNIKRYRLSIINHQQKWSINGICGNFDIKSNYFGPVITKSFKSFEKLNRKVIAGKIKCY